MDMIFTARQTQEKCREQHQDLLMVFINLKGVWLRGQRRTMADPVENRMSAEVREHNTFISRGHDGSSDRRWQNICSIQYYKRNQTRMRAGAIALL